MEKSTNNILYQKTGITISHVAFSLLSKNVGDRIPPVSEYQKEFDVSRGTVQNAFDYLRKIHAVELKSRGYLGTFIEKIDYGKLQENMLIQEVLGIMPLPYSRTYEGLATAIYDQLKNFRFNMAYARGAVGRIRLVETGTYQFAVCSQYAAEHAIANGQKIEIVRNFGSGSFLSRHVLALRDANTDRIQDGMRVAYDCDSLDQSELTKILTKGKKVDLVDIRTQMTLTALENGIIDAGVWNYDASEDIEPTNSYHFAFLSEEEYDSKFATAVIVIQKGDVYLRQFLEKNIHTEYTLTVLDDVRNRRRHPSY